MVSVQFPLHGLSDTAAPLQGLPCLTKQQANAARDNCYQHPPDHKFNRAGYQPVTAVALVDRLRKD
jgi:hypothetical protein